MATASYCWTLICAFVITSAGWTSAENLNHAFERHLANIRDDDVRGNASAALGFFEENPSVHSRLWRAYDSTDGQGKEVILTALMQSETFRIDQKFLDVVMLHMKHPNQYGYPTENIILAPVTYLFPDFLEHNFSRLGPSIPFFIQEDDIYIQASVTRVIFLRHQWIKYSRYYTDDVMRSIAKNLKNDDIPRNAMQAGFIFYLLGKHGAPVLHEVTAWRDAQAKAIAIQLLRYQEGTISKEQLAEALDGDSNDIKGRKHPGKIWLNRDSFEVLEMPGQWSMERGPLE